MAKDGRNRKLLSHFHTQQHHIISIQQTSKFKANDLSKILILMYVKAYYLSIAFR